MGSLDLEIRHGVADYLAGVRSLHDFRNWLAEATWNVEQRENAMIAALAREVELLLAEYEHGDWSEAELGRKLAPFATRYSVTSGVWITSSTSAVQQFERITTAAPLRARVDIRFVAVSS